jgi:hypothetical protein
MLGAAQSYVSAQRALIAGIHQGFEAAVRSGLVASDELAGLQEAIARVPLDSEIVELRDRHKMLYEALVWTQLLGFDGQVRAGGFMGGAPYEVKGVTPPMWRYFRHRFGRTIQAWFASLSTGRTRYQLQSDRSVGIDLRNYGTGGESLDEPFRPKRFESLDSRFQDAAVHRFFVTLAKDLVTVRRQLAVGAGGDGFLVNRPPTAKTKD